MKNSKGFTLVEVLAAFVILGIIIGIGIVSYQFIMARVERNYYETLEQELLLAGSDYYNNNRNEKPVSGYSVVLIDDLIGNKYIETLKDRSGKVCGSNNDSKVYIYKTDTGYDYEACLVCNDNYQSTGNYCNGNILGEVFVSAKKENTNAEYNVLKTSYSNTSWSNESVVVTFKMIDKNVTKYVIVNANDNSEKICNATNNSCSMTFNSSGSYTVKAYDGDVTVGAKKSFHVKIDKEKPSCLLNITENGTLSATYQDIGDSNISYYGFSSLYSGTSSNDKTISTAGNYTYYVKDNAGNVNTCDINVLAKTQYRYQECTSCKACSSASCIDTYWQTYNSSIVFTGSCSLVFPYEYNGTRYIGCKATSGNSEVCNFTCPSYEVRTCSRYEASCSKCGCDIWDNFSDWSDTEYSASSSVNVETKTFYYSE